MIDTGATTTFINKNLLEHLKHLECINNKPYFCLLADGVARFRVTGIVNLRICFANIFTEIEAHVAHNLCTNIILGMDYINRYNLSIDVKHQSISIEHNDRLLTMTIDEDSKPSSTSVVATRSPGVNTVISTTNIDNQINHIESPYPFLPSIINRNSLINTTMTLSCNALSSPSSSTDSYIQALVKTVQNKQNRDRLHSLLTRFSKTFDISQHNIAKTSIHHVIHTIPHAPPACKPYPQPDKEQAMYKLMQEFLHAGLISESHSPYAAPAILVKKKDQSYRFVVDYKRLNAITIKDSSPLPNMEDTLRKLGEGYNFFSKLDLKSGFYQIPIRETDKPKTGFCTPFGLYQFNVLPMGLKNSPPTFQKVMTDTLKFCRLFSLVYLDDIIVFSKSFEEHLYHLENVLLALHAKQLVLNPPKCVFAVDQIDYLRHTITYNKITPMKEKIQAIIDIKEPRTLAQANKFIGALSWYRKFIPHFATLAAPIHSITNLTKDNRN